MLNVVSAEQRRFKWVTVVALAFCNSFCMSLSSASFSNWQGYCIGAIQGLESCLTIDKNLKVFVHSNPKMRVYNGQWVTICRKAFAMLLPWYYIGLCCINSNMQTMRLQMNCNVRWIGMIDKVIRPKWPPLGKR